MIDKPIPPAPKEPQFILYQTEDGKTRIDVRFDGDSVWLTQAYIADLFQTSTQNITMHIKEILEDGELSEVSTCKEYLQVQNEGTRKVNRNLKFYSLEMILAIGYRVRSHRGIQFRRWATERLKEYIQKGFTLDDERLKSKTGGAYFEELLARIRDIRSSEKIFWRKVLDIYATSIDYDPHTEISQNFFATIQNKMHWAAHGQTAAELIASRANAELPFMGLTSWTGSAPKKNDVTIAKNYLNEKELNVLNRIVTAYLEFAELQALNRKTMYMKDWVSKLDDFLKLTDHKVLSHAGKVSHEKAMNIAETEYLKYQEKNKDELSQVERDFLEAAKKIEKSLPDKRSKDKKGKDDKNHD